MVLIDSNAIDSYINDQVSIKKADLQSQASSLQSQITDAENAVLAKDRMLTNEIAGFKTGIIPKAYQGTDAGVLIRDPMSGITSSAPPVTEEQELSIFTIAVVCGILYLIVRKGT